MTVKVFREFNEELQNRWDSLEEKLPYRNIYLSFLWYSTWWEVFGERGKLFVLVVENDSETVGIAPLMLVQTPAFFPVFRQLIFVGTGLSDYHDFLIADGFQKDVVAALLQFLKSEFKSWNLLRLRHFPENSLTPQIIQKELTELDLGKHFHYVHRPTVKCPFIPVISEWDVFYKAVSRNLRADVNRKYNKLRKNYEFRFEKVEPVSEEEFEKYLNYFVHINQKRWQQKNARNIFSFESEKHRRFYRLVTANFSQKRWVLFYVLWLNNNPVAYIYCFKFGNKIYHWNTAFDPQYFNLSVGKVLHRLAIEDVFNSGYDELDFMRGDEDYKLKWTQEARTNSEVILFYQYSLFARVMGYYYLTLKPYLENSGWVERGFRVWNKMKATSRL